MQVDRFLEAVAAEDACVLVHCGGGKGRAGTFVACCLAMWGLSPPFDLTVEKPVLSAQEAVRIVRNLRPGSIETQEQETFVQASPTQCMYFETMVTANAWLSQVMIHLTLNGFCQQQLSEST